MDIKTQANQLRGFVESLKLSDNISKPQLEMLFSKLDLLIETLDDDVDWDSLPTTTSESRTIVTGGPFTVEDHDDLPF
jgi:hypothetical protein